MSTLSSERYFARRSREHVATTRKDSITMRKLKRELWVCGGRRTVPEDPQAQALWVGIVVRVASIEDSFDEQTHTN